MSRHLHLHLHFTPIYLPPTLLHTELWSDHAESSRSLSLTGLMTGDDQTQRYSSQRGSFKAISVFCSFRLRRAGTGPSRRSLTPLRRAGQGLPLPTDQSLVHILATNALQSSRQGHRGEGALPFGTHPKYSSTLHQFKPDAHLIGNTGRVSNFHPTLSESLSRVQDAFHMISRERYPSLYADRTWEVTPHPDIKSEEQQLRESVAALTPTPSKGRRGIDRQTPLE